MPLLETGNFLSHIKINYIDYLFMVIEIVSYEVDQCLFGLVIEFRCDFDY